jgi:hypothetical protein
MLGKSCLSGSKAHIHTLPSPLISISFSIYSFFFLLLLLPKLYCDETEEKDEEAERREKYKSERF